MSLFRMKQLAKASINAIRALVMDGTISKSQYHTILGLKFGYKLCCIKNYVNLEILEIAPAGFTYHVLGQYTPDTKEVLCPMCYDEWRATHEEPEQEPDFYDPGTGQPVNHDEEVYYKWWSISKTGEYGYCV